MKKKLKIHDWKTAPISSVCEVQREGQSCGQPTTHAYPAMGRGWMALCYTHAEKHRLRCMPITELFLAGETLIARDAPKSLPLSPSSLR